jgi:hypothetical protein
VILEYESTQMNGFRKVIFLERCCKESFDGIEGLIGDEFREGNDVWRFILVDDQCHFRASDEVHDDVSHTLDSTLAGPASFPEAWCCKQNPLFRIKLKRMALKNDDGVDSIR